MIRIAIDTCSPVASFAVARGDGSDSVVHTYEGVARVADVIFEDLRRAMLERAGSERSLKIGMIVATVGPGSFTGQRLGLSIAQGLAAAHSDALLYGPTTLLAAAVAHAGAAATSDLMAIADARKDQFYVQSFGAACAPLSDCELVDLADLHDRLTRTTSTVLALDDAAMSAAPGGATVAVGGTATARSLVSVAKPETLGLSPTARLRPLYLKPPDAKPSRPPGLRASV